MSHGAEKIQICEVAPRDGLQSLNRILTVEQRVAMIEMLASAGLDYIEAGAMVHPQKVPAMAGSGEVYKKAVAAVNGRYIRFSLLAPNMRGLNDALAAGCRHIAFFTASSDTFNRKNVQIPVAEHREIIKEMAQEARRQNVQTLRLYLSTVFHCPFEGVMNPAEGLELFSDLFTLFDEISIGDTTGRAEPRQVEELLGGIDNLLDAGKIWWHFHDTYNKAGENARLCMQKGFVKYDSSAGGIGGCPFAPGAAGNISTVTLLKIAAEQGIETGINIDRLNEAASVAL